MDTDDLRKRLTAEVLQRILSENWFSHDARWFLKVSAEYGFDVGNRLNQTTLKSMAKTEMRRLLEATGYGDIESGVDFAQMVELALAVYFPPPMLVGEVNTVDRDSVKGTITRCLVFDEVRKAGITGIYECACGCRHEGWLEACDLQGQVKIEKSMMRGDPVCEIAVTSISRVPRGEEAGSGGN
jgi:hypothetical protein